VRIAHIAPVATTIPPPKSGSVETMTSLLTEGLVACGEDVTLFATADSKTKAKLNAIYPHGYWHDEHMWPWELYEMLNLAAAVEQCGRFDIIHYEAAYYPMSLAFTRLCATPIVQTLHHSPSAAEVQLWTRYPEAPFVAISKEQASLLKGLNVVGTVLHAHQHLPDGTPDEVRRLASAGHPFFDTAIRIERADGTECDRDEIGEVLLRGPSMMSGYWNNRAGSDETLRGGWMHTGDGGYMDDEGYFFLVDRLKRMINAAGFKVWPAEVETKLFSHPAVKEACVIASLDPRRGEQVKAVIVLRDGAQATGQDIIAWAREHMASYKVPTEVEFAASLPRSATGKVQWRTLQEEELRRRQPA